MLMHSGEAECKTVARAANKVRLKPGYAVRLLFRASLATAPERLRTNHYANRSKDRPAVFALHHVTQESRATMVQPKPDTTDEALREAQQKDRSGWKPDTTRSG